MCDNTFALLFKKKGVYSLYCPGGITVGTLKYTVPKWSEADSEKGTSLTQFLFLRNGGRGQVSKTSTEREQKINN